MIIGSMDNFSLLAALPEPFREALALVHSGVSAEAELGRHAIRDGGMFLQISEYETAAPESTRPEAHREFCDIQYIQCGREAMGWAVLGGEGQRVGIPYDSVKDLEFYEQCPGIVYFALHPGMFAIFMPEDIHQPGLHPEPGRPSRVRKHLVKIRASLIP